MSVHDVIEGYKYKWHTYSIGICFVVYEWIYALIQLNISEYLYVCKWLGNSISIQVQTELNFGGSPPHKERCAGGHYKLRHSSWRTLAMWPKLAIWSAVRRYYTVSGQKSICCVKCLFLYMMNWCIDRLWNSAFDELIIPVFKSDGSCGHTTVCIRKCYITRRGHLIFWNQHRSDGLDFLNGKEASRACMSLWKR
jgi:hypothetical protein